MADFAFLYGTFPTAPTVYVLATRYGVAASIIASTMVACTFLSAPIVFVSGNNYDEKYPPLSNSFIKVTMCLIITIVSLILLRVYFSSTFSGC